MKFRPIGAELLHADGLDGQADRHDEANNRL